MKDVVRRASSLGLTLIPEMPDAASEAVSFQSMYDEGAAVDKGEDGRLSGCRIDVGGGCTGLLESFRLGFRGPNG